MALSRIAAAIDVRTHRLGSHRSITDENGGPAETWVRVISHVKSQSSMADLGTP
eukprot:CAMPEP_0169278340 /NCGR_PEP_ID=MMETSP1016-20121227/54253_1 /TAXON_ID=342587 /ORGANISM="Karlodinium micrum, Strain CCMP2283" /LENGTH=53 /DNA_ID=CAMNT_0009366055 /DNA_START=575 /DNA_END=732 /DNA_ORIENTATION=+